MTQSLEMGLLHYLGNNDFAGLVFDRLLAQLREVKSYAMAVRASLQHVPRICLHFYLW